MRRAHCLALVFVTATCGCSTLDLSKAQSLWPAASEKPQQPASIVAIWSEGVVHQASVPPIRGYAGRILFYDASGAKPVKVDGTLTVYAFDETGRSKADTRPDRKYVFTPEQLANRYDPVKVGPAYAIWIPWDEAGGPRKDISLIVRFAPRSGQIVIGEMARLVLNGTTTDPAPAEASQSAARMGDPMVRQTSYETSAAACARALPSTQRTEDSLRSTTIQLPDDMLRRLQQRRAASSASIGVQRADGPSGPRQTASVAGMAPSSPASSSPGAGLSPASPHGALPATHWSPGRPRVPGVPIAPLTRDRGASPPRPAGPPSPPEPTPPPAPPAADALPGPAPSSLPR